MSGNNLSPLTAISPIDGRYHNQTEVLGNYFSEFGLIKYRVLVEIEYLIELSKLRLDGFSKISPSKEKELKNIYKNLSLKDAQEIKDTEKITNHDVKAVEYFVKKKIEELGLGKSKEFVHFGLTSQDINNTAQPMMIRDAIKDVILPELLGVLDSLKEKAILYKDISLLARTHGQAASPTNLGKEFMVFVERLEKQIKKITNFKFEGKFSGATGNFNAHHIAYPSIVWMKWSDKFLKKNLGLKRQQFTTQIEHYDELSELFQIFERIEIILIDFSRDVWQYISQDYFSQKTKEGEVGSSAMPHKVNPIDFENAEGNFGYSEAIFHHLASKLPISRLQRDLTDSTVMRNMGVPFSHLLIALKSLNKGIGKLEVNKPKILEDLDNNPLVIAEAIQTVLRSIGYDGAYEVLKNLTRGNKKLTLNDIHNFIDELQGVPDGIKVRLKTITPQNYTGTFPEIA